MSGWEGSDRRSRLPPNWSELVNKVWKRDKGQCMWRLPSGSRCPRPGSDVDHRRNDDDHSMSNLQLLCRHHHDKKTARESWLGKKKRRPSRRPEERHPGLR